VSHLIGLMVLTLMVVFEGPYPYYEETHSLPYSTSFGLEPLPLDNDPFGLKVFLNHLEFI
jgi:hypothetical protein